MLIGTFAGNSDVDFGAAKKATPQQKAASLLRQAKNYRALAAKSKVTKTKTKYLAKAATLEAQAKALGHVAGAAAAAATASSAPPLPPTAPNIRAVSAKHLQAALVILGRTVNDKILSAIKVDGAPGAKTASAVNRAFVKYATQAEKQYRTGKLKLTYIKANSGTLANILDAEIRHRGGTVVAPEMVAGAKATVKKSTALKKVADAKKKQLAAKAQAAVLRKQAAALKASNPAAAARLEARANGEELLATHAEKEEAEATSEAAKASVEESTAVAPAAAAAAVEAAAAVTPTAAPELIKPEAAEEQATKPRITATEPEGGPTAIEPAAVGPAEESFFGKHKIPIIVGGAVLLLGAAAIALKKPISMSPRRGR